MSIENSQTEVQREEENGGKKPEQSIQELWGDVTEWSIYIPGIPEGEEERLKKNMGGNDGQDFSKINDGHKAQIQEAQRA